MNRKSGKTTRRAFFVSGGALLGGGIAATATGAAPAHRAGAQSAADREAIRGLQRTALGLVQASRYDSLAALIVSGDRSVMETLAQHTALHTGYRQDVDGAADLVTLSDDGASASTTFHVEAEVTTPLVGDETIVAMARLQGNFAARHYERGRFDARYARIAGTWTMTSLRYSGA